MKESEQRRHLKNKKKSEWKRKKNGQNKKCKKECKERNR